MPRVSVVDPGPDRRAFRLRFVDPVNGRTYWRSAKTAVRREADRAALEWERELGHGREPGEGLLSWEAFRRRYEAEHLPSLSLKGAASARTALNHLERLIGPKKLGSVSAGVLSAFAAGLRAEGSISETSVKTYLGAIRAALNWAKAMHLVGFVPAIPTVQRARSARGSMSKGRPISEDEFRAVLEAVPAVVGQAAAASWRHWLVGLWWSGLRLEESLELYWDRADRLHVELSGEYPMLRVHGELEKGGQDRLLPIAPEFAAFLLRTPADQRTGRVFRLGPVDCGKGRPRAAEITDPNWASRIGARIGRAAGVVVSDSPTGKVKHASAHDMRRSFGTRWARRVMPAVLQALMRHEHIETTMRYYVAVEAGDVARQVWAAVQPVGGEVAKCSVFDPFACFEGQKAEGTGFASGDGI